MNARSPRAAQAIRPVQDSGFSLVEVVIAIGIFAFAVVGIVYLLGSGLSSSRDSAKDSSIAAALRSVDSTMRTISSGTLAGTVTTSGTSFYFDLFGNMLTSGSASNIYYTANVQRVNAASTEALTGMTNPWYGNTYTDSGTTTPGRYFLWKVTFLYPYPTNTLSTHQLVGGASYDPTFPHD